MNIFGTRFDYKARLTKVRNSWQNEIWIAVLVHLWPNQYYISGMYQHLPWYPVEVAPATDPFDPIQRRRKDPVFLCAWLTYIGLKKGRG